MYAVDTSCVYIKISFASSFLRGKYVCRSVDIIIDEKLFLVVTFIDVVAIRKD